MYAPNENIDSSIDVYSFDCAKNEYFHGNKLDLLKFLNLFKFSSPISVNCFA